jgi:GntR family transcriptional regulator, transcriptional repressor for pyruvate dehydrogenase complex
MSRAVVCSRLMSPSSAYEAMATIRAPASYELVVDQIRRAIQIGRFLAGEKLPSERELADQLGVSRTTVREAMRVLQGEGLIETRRGRSGGAVVTAPESTPAERRQIVRQRLAELENVFDYRLAIEPAAARLAAQRRTRADIARLEETLVALRAAATGPDAVDLAPVSRFFAHDADFHHQIALAARNPLLVQAVSDARAAMFLPVGGVFTALHPHANSGHEEIYEAIKLGDAEAARQAMTDHIELTRQALRDMARPPRGRG